MKNIAALEVSAPGKLFLFGEYAVLSGAWCVVSAVDLRARAHRRAAASGYKLVGAEFDAPLALPRAIVSASGRPEVEISRLGADVRALYDPKTGEKLGVGSSAASATALAGALHLSRDAALKKSVEPEKPSLNDRKTIFNIAFLAHRALQNGRGSGADIAASVFGETIAYRLRRPAEAARHNNLSAETNPTIQDASKIVTRYAEIIPNLCLPKGLRILPIWLGRPASSTSFTRAFEAARAQNPEPIDSLLGKISLITEEALGLLLNPQLQHNPRHFQDLIDRGDQAMEELGALIKAPIISDAHQRLRQIAANFDISVKPSGAGGGDFSLAAAPIKADWEGFLSALPDDLRPMPFKLNAPGLTLL